MAADGQPGEQPGGWMAPPGQGPGAGRSGTPQEGSSPRSRLRMDEERPAPRTPLPERSGSVEPRASDLFGVGEKSRSNSVEPRASDLWGRPSSTLPPRSARGSEAGFPGKEVRSARNSVEHGGPPARVPSGLLPELIFGPVGHLEDRPVDLRPASRRVRSSVLLAEQAAGGSDNGEDGGEGPFGGRRSISAPRRSFTSLASLAQGGAGVPTHRSLGTARASSRGVAEGAIVYSFIDSILTRHRGAEAAALLEKGRMGALSLRFADEPLERTFRREYARQGLIRSRICGALFLLICLYQATAVGVEQRDAEGSARLSFVSYLGGAVACVAALAVLGSGWARRSPQLAHTPLATLLCLILAVAAALARTFSLRSDAVTVAPTALAALVVICRVLWGWGTLCGLAVFGVTYGVGLGRSGDPLATLALALPLLETLALMAVVGRALEATARRNFLLARLTRETQAAASAEKQRSDQILRNVLPESVIEAWKEEREHTINRRYDGVAVVFVNLADPPATTAQNTHSIMPRINAYLAAMEDIAERRGLLKIKTIGFVFMAACGLPEERPEGEAAAAAAAFALDALAAAGRFGFPIKVGLHVGPVVAGIIGCRVFYDVFGDSVNVAQRMCSYCAPGAARVSGAFAAALSADKPPLEAPAWRLSEPQPLSVKGKGIMTTHTLGPAPPAAAAVPGTAGAGGRPSLQGAGKAMSFKLPSAMAAEQAAAEGRAGGQKTARRSASDGVAASVAAGAGGSVPTTPRRANVLRFAAAAEASDGETAAVAAAAAELIEGPKAAVEEGGAGGSRPLRSALKSVTASFREPRAEAAGDEGGDREAPLPRTATRQRLARSETIFERLTGTVAKYLANGGDEGDDEGEEEESLSGRTTARATRPLHRRRQRPAPPPLGIGSLALYAGQVVAGAQPAEAPAEPGFAAAAAPPPPAAAAAGAGGSQASGESGTDRERSLQARILRSMSRRVGLPSSGSFKAAAVAPLPGLPEEPARGPAAPPSPAAPRDAMQALNSVLRGGGAAGAAPQAASPAASVRRNSNTALSSARTGRLSSGNRSASFRSGSFRSGANRSGSFRVQALGPAPASPVMLPAPGPAALPPPLASPGMAGLGGLTAVGRQAPPSLDRLPPAEDALDDGPPPPPAAVARPRSRIGNWELDAPATPEAGPDPRSPKAAAVLELAGPPSPRPAVDFFAAMPASPGSPLNRGPESPSPPPLRPPAGDEASEADGGPASGRQSVASSVAPSVASTFFAGSAPAPPSVWRQLLRRLGVPRLEAINSLFACTFAERGAERDYWHRTRGYGAPGVRACTALLLAHTLLWPLLDWGLAYRDLLPRLALRYGLQAPALAGLLAWSFLRPESFQRLARPAVNVLAAVLAAQAAVLRLALAPPEAALFGSADVIVDLVYLHTLPGPVVRWSDCLAWDAAFLAIPLASWGVALVAAGDLFWDLLMVIVVAALASWVRELESRTEYVLNRDLQRETALLAEECAGTEHLLELCLPPPVAERLKASEGGAGPGRALCAQYYESVAVLCADIVGFTPLSASLDPSELVAMLNELYSELDELAYERGVQHLKTIGDAWLAVVGLEGEATGEAVARLVDLAAAAVRAFQEYAARTGREVAVRVGVASGHATGAVLGKRRWMWDMFGEAMDLAFRMEGHSLPGRIHLSREVAEAVRGRVPLEPRAPPPAVGSDVGPAGEGAAPPEAESYLVALAGPAEPPGPQPAAIVPSPGTSTEDRSSPKGGEPGPPSLSSTAFLI